MCGSLSIRLGAVLYICQVALAPLANNLQYKVAFTQQIISGIVYGDTKYYLLLSQEYLVERRLVDGLSHIAQESFNLMQLRTNSEQNRVQTYTIIYVLYIIAL